MTDLPPTARPDLAAGLERLADKVVDLTDAVERERVAREADTARTLDHVAAVKHADDRYRRLMAVLFALALLGAAATTGAFIRSNLVTCQNGNTSRGAVRGAFSEYTAALVAVPPAEPLTVEQQAAREARVAGFVADVDRRLAPLRPRDCSIVNAVFPQPVRR